MHRHRFKFHATAGLSILLLCGCTSVEHWTLTGALWDNERLASHREPAIPPDLRLYEGTGDVVVTYYESSDSSDRRIHRGYALRENNERIREQQKPNFLKETPERGVEIPQTTTGTDASDGLYALVSEDGRKFSLVRDGKIEGPHELPVYLRTSGTRAKIALTPVTIVGDTIIYASVLGIIFIANGGLNEVQF